MSRSWRRHGEPAARLLGAVVAYLRLLEAQWETLDDAQRRSAIRLALEAAEPYRLASVREPGFPESGTTTTRQRHEDGPGRPNA